MKKLKLNYRKIKIYAVCLIMLALLSFQILVDVSVYHSLVQTHADQGTVITSLVSDSVNNLNKPAPIDPTTGKIYLPEAHLVLPAYSGLGQIEYQYETGQYTTNNATEIHLTSSQILNLAKNILWVDAANANNREAWQSFDVAKIFSGVPSLQACTRGVQIFYAEQHLGGDYAFQGSHKVKDGRTLYVYSETDCKQDQSAVISLAQQAQSY